MDFATRSDIGAAPRNEDTSLASPERGLFVVCDGLGGPTGGEVASKLAQETLAEWAAGLTPLIKDAGDNPSKESREALEVGVNNGFQEASRKIFESASQEKFLHGMCSTMDMVLLVGNLALVAHVGSSRVYLSREGEVHLLTEDHTQLAYLRRVGKLDTVPVADHPNYARRLTRAVGFRAEVNVDYLWVELEPGDRFLMVSDGVWQALGDDSTSKLAGTAAKPDALVSAIHSAVEAVKGRDNYTSLVLLPEIQPAVQASDVETEAASAMQKIKMLGRVPAFEYLSYQELLKVLSAGELVKVQAGEVLCKEGDAGGEMMLVLAGQANVTKKGQVLRALGKGDVFGEMSMLDNAARSATVVAAVPTNLLAFPRAVLFDLFREDANLAVKFLWGVTMEMNRRLRVASNQLVGQAENEGVSGPAKGPLPFHRSV
jgi:serine/threonine protein phosphatase PrpC